MFCTTNQELIRKEIATARRVIAKLQPITNRNIAQADALAAAFATLRTYADWAS